VRIVFLLVTAFYTLCSVAHAETRTNSFLQCPQTLSTKSRIHNYIPSLTNLCMSLPSLDWNTCANHLLTMLANGDSKENIFPSTVAVTRDPHPNAYLTEVNSILITSGLTTLIHSGQQLAFVLAHEIAHGLIERCGVNEGRATDKGYCQRVISRSNYRTEASSPIYGDIFHELNADRIALGIMRGMPFESNNAASLLRKISELQKKRSERTSHQMQVRINALEENEPRQETSYF